MSGIENEITKEIATSTAASSDPYAYKMLQCNTSLQNITNTYELFRLVTPMDDPNWEERDIVYWVFFYLMVVIFVMLFFMLGVGSIVLIMKRHLAVRFKLRTFIAIDLALCTLGFSRVIFLIFNPWNQYGFCTHHACTAISRLLNALAFPSITASYTLVFITLWMSARIQLGPSNVQKVKILIPLCLIHYVVAIAFEIIGSLPLSTALPILILLMLCETVFSLWGFLVCFSFLFAGFRLLKTVEKSARQSSMICRDSPSMTREQLVEKSKFSNRKSKEIRQRSRSTMKLKHMLRERHQRAIRKITLLTYITVILGILYSAVSVANLIQVAISIFHGCPGYIRGMKQLPSVWLTFRYIFFTLEILLAVLLTYAINDSKPVVEFVKKRVTSVCGLRRVSSPRENSLNGRSLNDGSIQSSSDTFSPTKPFPGVSLLAQTPPTPQIDVDEKSDSSFELPSNVPSPPASPSLVTPKLQANDQSMMIMEYKSSPLIHRAPVKSNTPKHPSPLTVSFSLSDEEIPPSNLKANT